jgi:peptidoglycan/xylan/chitin deacetylase (PgdA/CDA1 family)
MNRIKKAVFIGGIIAVVVIVLSLFTMARHKTGQTVRVPIFMYHEIGETTNNPWCVPTDTFQAQMLSLRAQGYKTILPSDLIAHRHWGKPLPCKPMMLTFDDGYLSNLKIVEPILKENNFRGVIYLITSQIAETPERRLSYEDKPCLVWPEVLSMQERQTFVFGGHAHAHNNLIVDPQADFQINECFRQLVLHGIIQPYSFCYPHGQKNEETARFVRRAGFQTALVCEDAVADIKPGSDLFALPRVSVMGGRHVFCLVNKTFNENDKTVVFRIIHDGLPIEISPCLCGAAPQWLPARELSQGEFELRFKAENTPAERGSAVLEIWDKHRLFKLTTVDYLICQKP